MGSWSVDNKAEQGVLRLRVAGHMSVDEMRDFVVAHNRAIDDFKGADYRVWCDIRELSPMPPDCTVLMEAAKKYSSEHKNFKGSAVLVSSALLAMQHQRTSQASGVLSSEITTENEDAARAHLSRVDRRLS